MPLKAREKELQLAMENNPAPAAGTWNAHIKRYTGSTQPIFRVVGFYHLTGEENVGKRNLFISVLDENLIRIYNPPVEIEWGWEGQKPTEHPNNVKLDKPITEPMGNISLDAGQIVHIKVAGASSDEIGGIHTGWDSDGPGNYRFHHSFFVVLQRNPGTSQPPTPTPEPPKPSEPVTKTYHIEDDDFKIVLTVTSKP